MKKNIAILRGGNSSEKIVSIKSADVVYNYIDKEKYNAFIVHIENDNWHLCYQGQNYNIDKNDFSAIVKGKKISFDGVFMAIHGSPGEDGVLQSYFDIINIPYNCCGPFEASITFNKAMCNALLKQFNIKSAEAIILNKEQEYSITELENKLGLPCFVKPNRAGSSFGVSKVAQSNLWKQAIDAAFKHDQQIIIESFVKGTEVTCGIIKKEGKLIALPLTEIVSENDFFDYEAKYQGKAQEITPARINSKETVLVQKTSKKIYELLNLKGMVRMDYIVEDGEPYLIEVNTVPGLSEESIIPQQALAYGMQLEELFSLSIENMLADD